ncbi:hypothetical protein [Microbacterium sp. SL75]|uniref:hypothetical protein n=1 Tax=Microbacterium sp. SL75 TaxID=2995140 RepID=UPI00226D47AB|nr:hypothetical protein [Microbacterium sp. SL75]WAC68888.1 hypothetical protein OVA17_15070 [Microbacterium sp. SL75]
MSVTEHECGCGEKFVAPGTVHGQPAGLWQLLEHQSTNHPKGVTVTIPAIPVLAAWQAAAEESYTRMRAHAVAELSTTLGEDVPVDEDGAIVLDEDQRARLLGAVPTRPSNGWTFDSAWGVPIRRAEGADHANGIQDA